MAPPNLFINTKTLDLEKQPENEKEDGFEDLEQKDEKKDKGDDNAGSDPSEGINKENGKAKFPLPLPIFSYIVVSNGLAITLAGAFLGINWAEPAAWPGANICAHPGV